MYDGLHAKCCYLGYHARLWCLSWPNWKKLWTTESSHVILLYIDKIVYAFIIHTMRLHIYLILIINPHSLNQYSLFVWLSCMIRWCSDAFGLQLLGGSFTLFPNKRKDEILSEMISLCKIYKGSYAKQHSSIPKSCKFMGGEWMFKILYKMHQ